MTTKPLIAVTGVNGQVGGDINQIHLQFADVFDFLFIDRSLMNLTSEESIHSFFESHKPQFFINCAAYTAVDKAESEQDIALQINGTSVQIIANHCATINCILINVSTDYVFDGLKTTPYLPNDAKNPINVYGHTKAVGELATIENKQNIVVRTSWVYNKTGKNFVNTMLRLMKDRQSINVVADQIGCPTYSPDLALALLQMASKVYNSNYQLQYHQVYHFSNVGAISWYNFAEAIREISESTCLVNPISTEAYPTPAKRSIYSVMDCSDIEKDFGVALLDWKTSLAICLAK